MTASLMSALPIMGEAAPVAGGLQQVDGVEVGSLFDRANRFLYLSQWKRYGHHRAYIRDEDGEQYGYRDLNSGELHLDHTGDVMVEAVLAAATAKGVDASLRVPKLPIRMPGGRLLSMFGRINTTVIVGSEWRGRNGMRRLYGTLANPTEGTFDLGYVTWSQVSSRLRRKAPCPVTEARRSATSPCYETVVPSIAIRTRRPRPDEGGNELLSTRPLAGLGRPLVPADECCDGGDVGLGRGPDVVWSVPSRGALRREVAESRRRHVVSATATCLSSRR